MDHEDAVAATARHLQRARSASDRARDEHVAAVLAALRAGIPPTVVGKASPFTDAYIRQLAREAGIPPARKGQRAD